MIFVQRILQLRRCSCIEIVRISPIFINDRFIEYKKQFPWSWHLHNVKALRLAPRHNVCGAELDAKP